MPHLIALDFAKKSLSSSSITGAAGLYTDLLSDTMYKVSGTTVLPMFSAGAGAATAIYRTPRFIVDAQSPFGWLRLEGPVTSAVVRIYGNGVLVHTTAAITSNNPVRIPAMRYRELELEVESAGRVTDVTMASTSAELL